MHQNRSFDIERNKKVLERLKAELMPEKFGANAAGNVGGDRARRARDGLRRYSWHGHNGIAHAHERTRNDQQERMAGDGPRDGDCLAPY